MTKRNSKGQFVKAKTKVTAKTKTRKKSVNTSSEYGLQPVFVMPDGALGGTVTTDQAPVIIMQSEKNKRKQAATKKSGKKVKNKSKGKNEMARKKRKAKKVNAVQTKTRSKSRRKKGSGAMNMKLDTMIPAIGIGTLALTGLTWATSKIGEQFNFTSPMKALAVPALAYFILPKVIKGNARKYIPAIVIASGIMGLTSVVQSTTGLNLFTLGESGPADAAIDQIINGIEDDTIAGEIPAYRGSDLGISEY